MKFGAVELRHGRLELMLDAAVVVAAVATVGLLIAEELGGDPAALLALDWAIWLVFLAEYVVLFASAPDRRAYVRRSWLAALVVVVSFPGWAGMLELARLARLGRVLRVAFVTWRGLATLRAVAGRRELIEIGVITGFVMLGGGGLLALVEPDTVKGDYWSGVWWAVVTATTVGYGDVTPTTLIGRATAVVVMVVGIAAMSTLIAATANHFTSQQREDDLRDIREQLARIEAKLEQLDADRR